MTATLKLTRRGGRDITFEASDGEAVSFSCHGARYWPMWLLTFALPNLAISLSRE